MPGFPPKWFWDPNSGFHFYSKHYNHGAIFLAWSIHTLNKTNTSNFSKGSSDGKSADVLVLGAEWESGGWGEIWLAQTLTSE